jgi:hypothetical protein
MLVAETFELALHQPVELREAHLPMLAQPRYK